MRIVKNQRVGESARILPIHVKEGDIRGKSTSFLYFRKRHAKVTRINKISYLFSLIKRGPGVFLRTRLVHVPVKSSCALRFKCLSKQLTVGVLLAWGGGGGGGGCD